jgi:hypothetical protein
VTKEAEEFEKWYRSHWSNPFERETATGAYKDESVESEWRTWQAAWETGARAALEKAASLVCMSGGRDLRDVAAEMREWKVEEL